jgi:glutamine synthetase
VDPNKLKTHLQNEGIEYLLVQFVDLHGAPKVKMVPGEMVEPAIGSAVSGWRAGIVDSSPAKSGTSGRSPPAAASSRRSTTVRAARSPGSTPGMSPLREGSARGFVR